MSSTYVESRKIGNTEGKQLISDTRVGWKVSDVEPVSTIAYVGQKAQDTRAISIACAGQEAQDAKATSTTRKG